MDEKNIEILHEDLAKEFQALAKSHTTAIEQLLEEFNDDQILLKLEAEAYEQDRLQDEREAAATTQTARGPLTEEVSLEPAEENKPR